MIVLDAIVLIAHLGADDAHFCLPRWMTMSRVEAPTRQMRTAGVTRAEHRVSIHLVRVAVSKGEGPASSPWVTPAMLNLAGGAMVKRPGA